MIYVTYLIWKPLLCCPCCFLRIYILLTSCPLSYLIFPIFIISYFCLEFLCVMLFITFLFICHVLRNRKIASATHCILFKSIDFRHDVRFAQREMMFLNLVNSSYLNSNSLKVMYSSTYADIGCIHQLLLENILQCCHTFQRNIFNSSN